MFFNPVHTNLCHDANTRHVKCSIGGAGKGIPICSCEQIGILIFSYLIFIQEIAIVNIKRIRLKSRSLSGTKREYSGAIVLTAPNEVRNTIPKSIKMNCKQIAEEKCVLFRSLWVLFGQKMLVCLLCALFLAPLPVNAQNNGLEAYGIEEFHVSIEANKLGGNKIELNVFLFEDTVPMVGIAGLTVDLTFLENLLECSCSINLEDIWACPNQESFSTFLSSENQIHFEIQKGCEFLGTQGLVARMILDFPNDIPSLESLESAAPGGIVIMDDISMKRGGIHGVEPLHDKPFRTELWSIDGKKVMEFSGSSFMLPRGLFIRRQFFKNGIIEIDKLWIK